MKMKKLLFFAAALVSAATSCSKFEGDASTLAPSTEDGVKISIAVGASSAEDATRVAVDGDTWAVTWAENDAILMNNIDDNYGSCYKLEMESHDPEVSVFGCSYVNKGSYRLIHPYPATNKYSSIDCYYTFDLSSQKEGVNNTNMVSDKLIAVDAAGVVTGASGYNMQHVGSTIDLNVQMSGDAEGDYVINSVKLCDVPNAAVIDVTKMVTEDGFYSSTTQGDILVTLKEESAIAASSISKYQFNILPFERAAGEELTLKFYGVQASTGDNFMITKSFKIAENIAFARGTYNTLNAALSVDDIEMLGSAITVNEVNVGSLMITVDIDINKDVCDGYVYSCSETSDSPVGLADSKYYGYICHTSGAQPMRAALLGYETEYFISIVGYKLVDGAISPVGEVFETTVTTSGLAYDLTEDAITATYDNVTYTTIDAKFERGNAIAAFYGCVATSELAKYEGSVEAYISATNWYSEPINYAHVFYSSSYTSSLTYQICSGLTTFFDSIEHTFISLEIGTEYTMFTIPIGSNGLIGSIETQTVSTKTLTTDASILPTASATPASTSASFEFGLGNADYVLYRHVNTSQASYTDSDAVYDSFIDGESHSYVTAIKADDLTNGVYTTSISSLAIGAENYMYYIGVMEDGTMGEMQCITYSTVEPTYDAAASVNYSIASETISSGWGGNQATVIYDVEMTGEATSYIFYVVSQSSYSPIDVSTPEAAANHILALSYGNTPTSDPKKTIYFSESSEQYAVIIPITDDNTYGAPIMFQYAWPEITFDSSATVALSLASSNVESSTYQGVTETIATITMNVELGTDAVSYICGIISDVDATDSNAVGNAVVSLSAYNRQDSSDQVTREFNIYKDTDSYFAIVPVDADGAYGTQVVYEFDDWGNEGGGTTAPLLTLDVVEIDSSDSSITAIVNAIVSETVPYCSYAIIDSFIAKDNGDALLKACSYGFRMESTEFFVTLASDQYLVVCPAAENYLLTAETAVFYDPFEVAGTGSIVTPSLEVSYISEETTDEGLALTFGVEYGAKATLYKYAVCNANVVDPSTITSEYVSEKWDGWGRDDSFTATLTTSNDYIAVIAMDATSTILGEPVIYDYYNVAGGDSDSSSATPSLTFEVELENVGMSCYNAMYSVTLGGTATQFAYAVIDASSTPTSSVSMNNIMMSGTWVSEYMSFNEYLNDGYYIAMVALNSDASACGDIVISDPWDTASGSGSGSGSGSDSGSGDGSFAITSSATAVITPGDVKGDSEPYNMTFSVTLDGATSYIYYHYDSFESSDNDVTDTTDLISVGTAVVSRGTTTSNSSFDAALYWGNTVFVAVVPVDADGAYGTPVVLNFDDIIK